MKNVRKSFNLVIVFFLTFIFVYSIAIRLDSVVVQRLWPDEALYAWLAEVLSKDWTFLFRPVLWYPHPPLFPLILAPGIGMGPDILENLRIIAVVIELFSLAGLYLFTRHYFSDLVALVAVTVAASNIYTNFLAGFILMDCLFAFLHIPFMIALLRLKSRDSWGWDDFQVGLVGVLIALLKYYGGLFLIPWVIIYYLVALKDQVLMVRLKRSLVPVAMIGCFFLPFFLKTILPALLQGMTPDPVFTQSFFYYFKMMPSYLGGIFLFFLFFIGVIFFFLRYDNRKKCLLAAGIIIEVVALSCCSIKDLRYLSPVLFMAAIIMGIGVESVFKMAATSPIMRLLLRVIFTLLFFGLFFCDYYLLNSLNPRARDEYSGFAEAGSYIRAQDTPDTVILAGGIYQTRFWSKVELKDYGGRIESIPRTIEDMELFIKRCPRRILMEVDLWQYIQPSWVYPMTLTKMGRIEKLGFRLKLLVRKNLSHKLIPVAWVFERPASP